MTDEPIPEYLRADPEFGSMGRTAPVSTMFVHVACGRPLDARSSDPCMCCDTPRRGVVAELHRRRADVPVEVVDLYREPVWAS